MSTLTEKQKKEATATAVGGCLGWVLAFFLLLPLIVLAAWNWGLHGSGLVHNDIDYVTAVGLSLVVAVARSIFGAVRR